MRENDTLTDLSHKCQIHGVLSKKPFGHQNSTKWSKRFFVVKDGFLLYYTENERKDFEKRKHFNIHPKGCIPLGACSIAATTEPNQNFCIHIKTDIMNGNFVVATDSEYEQDRWVSILRQSSRISWSNSQLGDDMIKQLEVQGLQMAKERQDYFDKLQYEAMALHDEKQKTEELEKLNEELQKEREKMEKFASDLKEEYEKAKMELDTTVEAMKAVAEDKRDLNKQTQDLQRTLEELESQKLQTIRMLDKRTSEKEKLTQEHHNLSATSSHLQHDLDDIESRTQKLLDEKALIQNRLEEAESKAKQLEEDKITMMEHAEELKTSIKDLAAQKAITEAELKEEVLARLDAERRLREAEESLSRLERAVQNQGNPGRDSEEVKEEMIGDVKTLRRFFENIVFEAKLDADKPVMIKNAIHARKTMVRRAKTMKFEASKKRRSRGGTESVASCGSPVSPCECSPYVPMDTPLTPPRLTQSTLILSDDDPLDLAWQRHSVIGLDKMSLSANADQV